MDKERHNLVLGECVSAPAGHDQPALYEPVNRAMCMAAVPEVQIKTDGLFEARAAPTAAKAAARSSRIISPIPSSATAAVNGVDREPG